ncbi:MAG: CpaF family protein [Tissierellia bacterium]|jgi:pilus assembly protein CpaF|nr:CpaF family protein [Tissierellia bacterium]
MNAQLRRWLEIYSPESFAKKDDIIVSLLGNHFTEIMFNAWNEVFIEDDRGIREVKGLFYSREDYRRSVARFLAMYNQRLSVDRPIVDFDIDKGYRINVVNSHLTGGDIVMTIRRGGGQRFKEMDFLEGGFMSRKQRQLLLQLVRQRKTLFISGETSSGKTTLLNFLLGDIDRSERIVIIEDTAEIKAPEGSNCVYLRTKKKAHLVREVNTSDLVKTSLRMRPDRIILGEIRREEVVDFIHAINTGHQGSLCTGHGNSPQDMIARLEMLLMEAGIPYEAAQRYLGRGIDVIIQLRGKSERRLESISAVSFSKGEVEIHDIA